MKEEYAKKLISKVPRDYNAVSDSFSRAREKIWPEIEFLFGEFINKGDRVLDLGCGNGRFYNTISSQKALYVGVDNSSELIEVARKKHPSGDFSIGDALNLEFPDNYFNKIYSVAVLHHIPSDELRTKFLEESKRALKEEGLLVITAWNLWKKPKRKKKIIKNMILKILGLSNLDFGDVLIDWQGIRGCYFHCFKLKELENKISSVGFKIIRSGEVISRKDKSLSNLFVVAKK